MSTNLNVPKWKVPNPVGSNLPKDTSYKPKISSRLSISQNADEQEYTPLPTSTKSEDRDSNNNTATQTVPVKQERGESVHLDLNNLSIHRPTKSTFENQQVVPQKPPVSQTQNGDIPSDYRASSPIGDAIVYTDIGKEQHVVFAERENYLGAFPTTQDGEAKYMVHKIRIFKKCTYFLSHILIQRAWVLFSTYNVEDNELCGWIIFTPTMFQDLLKFVVSIQRPRYYVMKDWNVVYNPNYNPKKTNVISMDGPGAWKNFNEMALQDIINQFQLISGIKMWKILGYKICTHCEMSSEHFCHPPSVFVCDEY
ncbi:hypothetical protein BZA77DRAFT_292902 [Pyronema omphalodes]|nr:hypothetical protein BZA77DRAFT_292902 [Pyronema omphalodes]